MLKTVFLTQDFYKDYAHGSEIGKKETRPFVRIQIQINGILWAIPLRSHITHDNVIWTDKDNECGIDLSKAVVIEKPKQYISNIKPHIRPEEFKVIKKLDEYWVAKKFQQYIKDYKKAKKSPAITRNKELLKYSTLQYFEKYI